jgi:BirA family biotin operon repressor/biotin-[acetyl-CoA-carboxylase] ligase
MMHPDDGIIYLAEVDSTNSYCMREAASLASGTFVVADSQTAGRGRLGRAWHSPPGCNLYVSIILKPPFQRLDPAVLPQIASLAAYNTVQDYGVQGVWIKWPNDVYAGDRKLAGVLTESRIVAGAVEAVVTGIGINLNMSPAELAVIDKPATAVGAHLDRDIDRDDCLQRLAGYFNAACATCQSHGFEQIYAEWCDASGLVGRRVSINGAMASVTGIVREFAIDGSIVIVDETGVPQTVRSGDLTLILL